MMQHQRANSYKVTYFLLSSQAKHSHIYSIILRYHAMVSGCASSIRWRGQMLMVATSGLWSLSIAPSASRGMEQRLTVMPRLTSTKSILLLSFIGIRP